MLEKHLEHPNSALYRYLSVLKQDIHRNKIQPDRRHPPSFIFLCGANKSAGGISARREALHRFLSKESPESKTIIAEDFIKFLEYKNRQNLYDIENTLSGFADVIVIVLESYSAFTELGAFATKDLRQKLFVINDKKFEKQPSFINLGPIDAIKQYDSKAVGWYHMGSDGIENGDSIGEIFPALIDAIKQRRPTNEEFTFETLIPVGELNRWAFSFCHDVIFYARKSTFKELVLIYTFLFGDEDFDVLSNYKALLIALGLAKSEGEYLISTQSQPMLKEPRQRAALQAAFVSARYRMRTRS